MTAHRARERKLDRSRKTNVNRVIRTKLYKQLDRQWYNLLWKFDNTEYPDKSGIETQWCEVSRMLRWLTGTA
jgi:hypothetical protein